METQGYFFTRHSSIETKIYIFNRDLKRYVVYKILRYSKTKKYLFPGHSSHPGAPSPANAFPSTSPTPFDEVSIHLFSPSFPFASCFFLHLFRLLHYDTLFTSAWPLSTGLPFWFNGEHELWRPRWARWPHEGSRRLGGSHQDGRLRRFRWGAKHPGVGRPPPTPFSNLAAATGVAVGGASPRIRVR